MGGGEGSGGLRTCRKLGGKVSNCEEAVMAFRCKKFANGSRIAFAAGRCERGGVVNAKRDFQ